MRAGPSHESHFDSSSINICSFFESMLLDNFLVLFKKWGSCESAPERCASCQERKISKALRERTEESTVFERHHLCPIKVFDDLRNQTLLAESVTRQKIETLRLPRAVA